MGVLGPWGSGKTSLINLVRDHLSEPPGLTVLEFNPWLFSGADQLLESFFLEVGAQFRGQTDRLADLADDLEAYGEVVAPLKWLPIIGVWVERARSVTKALKKIQDRRKGGVLAQRDRLAAKLANLEAPVVIVIDDIDRLRTNEIREIFKLVRLTANFPNIVYLLAFDRARVENALSEEGLVGRDYLEKILQVAHDIPVMPETAVTRLLGEALDQVLNELEDVGPFSSNAWPDVLFEIVRPLIRNMRDIRRYVAAARGTVRGLGGRVELVDVLGLEAVRVFLPDVFGAINAGREGLTTPSSVGPYREDPSHLKKQVEGVIAAGGNHAEVARALIIRLFSAGQRHIVNNHYGPEWQRTWLRERRVAHPDVLAFYLERVVGQKLEAFVQAENLYEALTDETKLNAILDQLSVDQLTDAISSLEAFEGEYPIDGIVPASAALLNQMSRFPKRRPGMFGFDSELIVDRVVLRMLRQVESPEAVEAMVRQILPRTRLLSDRLSLLRLIGYMENAGHKLISQEAAQDLESEFREQVRQASARKLAQERDLLKVLYWFHKTAPESGEEVPDWPDEPDVLAALLRSALTETWSQSMGSRAQTRSPRLHWQALTEVIDEAAIRAFVETQGGGNQDDPELQEACEVANKYLSGWRPREFDED